MPQFRPKHVLLKTVAFLLLGLSIFLSFNFHSKSKKAVIWSDGEGYYMYLPAIFIYGGFTDYPVKTVSDFKKYPGTDKVFTKYTCGVALLQMPFFLAAHGIAKATGLPANGLSDIYSIGVMMGTLFWVGLGLWCLFQCLQRKFPPWIALVTLVCIFFGTNLYHYAIAAPSMSHAYSFGLFGVFIYTVSLMYERPGWLRFFIVALVLGVLVLIRPTAIFLALYLVFYRVNSIAALKGRYAFFKQHFIKSLLFPLLGILVWLPQIAYWQYLTGSPIFYSYESAGFYYWNRPQIFNVFFHVHNGLLVYSPIITFGLAGLLLYWKAAKENAWLILLIFCLATYAFASWRFWWFGGAFGARSFVEYYALLAIPFAYSLLLIWEMKSKLIKSGLAVLLGLMIFYNLHLTYRYNPPWDGPGWTWGRLLETILN